MKLIAVIFLLVFTPIVTKGMEMLKAGDIAPEFELKDSDGKIHKLSDYKGKIVVLYFYPKDDTPGCTAEACNLRDNYQALLEKNIAVLGVSYDDSSSHKAFREKYRLPFPLLSDTDKKTAELYGAKSGIMSIFFARRITCLIDVDGTVIYVFEDVNTKNHTSQILELLKEKQNIK